MVLFDLTNKQITALHMMRAIIELQNFSKYRAHDIQEIKQMIINNMAC